MLFRSVGPERVSGPFALWSGGARPEIISFLAIFGTALGGEPSGAENNAGKCSFWIALQGQSSRPARAQSLLHWGKFQYFIFLFQLIISIIGVVIFFIIS